MSSKYIAICGSLMSLLAFSNNVMSATDVQYSTIMSKYKGDVGKGKCLRTFSNDNSVSIGDCTAQGGESDDASMRQWEVAEQSNGYFLLKNKYKQDANEGQCIRTFNKSDRLEVGDCVAKGGGYDFTSMRLWKIVEDGAGYALLQNKYRMDAVKSTCIRTFSNNNSTSIGDCTAQGGASDYTSMREWSSEAFPFGTPWGPTGIVNIGYTIPNSPASGFNKITFPMKIDESPEARGFYYAMQYQFINGNSGYIGLQPKSKDSGTAVFSVFGSGVTPVAQNCSGSADGGEGSSCSKTISLVYGHQYNLTVKRDDENAKVWRGYVEDTTTGEINEIGAWQPRDGSQGIKNSQVGFVEYYPQINSCSKIPYTKAFFGSPIADSGISGTLKTPYTYGRCQDHVDFTTQGDSAGWITSVKGIK